MHKRTRLAMEEVSRRLRGTADLSAEDRAKLAGLLDERVREELSAFDSMMAEIRRTRAVDEKAGVVSSGRINRPAPIRMYDESRGAAGEVRRLSPIELSQPPSDR